MKQGIKNRFKTFVSNIIVIVMGASMLLFLIIDTITFKGASRLLDYIKSFSNKEVAKQLAVYKSLGNTVETFDIKRDYIREIEKVKIMAEESEKLLFSIKEQGKATADQKEILIRMITQLETVLE